MRKLTLFFVASLVLIISACGFHLRGESQVAHLGMDSVFIETEKPDAEVVQRIKKGLQNAGVTVVEKTKNRQMTLALSEPVEERRVISVGKKAEAAEFQLVNRIDYTLKTKDGTIVLGPNTAMIEKNYLNDPNEIVGKVTEERMLRREMWNAVAERVLRGIENSPQNHPSK